MSNSLVALLFAAGVSVWVYTKIMHKTGNNAKTSIITTGVAFAATFVVFWLFMGFITNLVNAK